MSPLFLLPILLLLLPQTQSTTQTYIIHTQPSTRSYTHLLHSLSSTSSPPPHLLYTYSHSATGFAARLTPVQAAELTRHPTVLSVSPDRVHQLHTTHTPDFLGLADGSGLWPNSGYASDVIVGVLDSGIWPEIPSFNDDGYDPVPDTWKGECFVGPSFPVTSCNRKLIGARAFYQGYEAHKGPMNETKESKSPRDTEGHGTHTASTAAGSVVADAGFFQYARGEAKGMAPKARIAAYKVCWSNGCHDSDILAAFDQAIEDGVDVISLSVGTSGLAPKYYEDSIAIGSLHAVQSGVLVSCSAGNSGPNPYTVTNIAPWILTVGASTLDREFPADVVLGDGRTFNGVSLYSGDPLNESEYLELVYGGDCGSRQCLEGELDSAKVSGKMVLCERGSTARVAKGTAVKHAGGAAMILANTAESGEELVADSHLVAATMVGQIAANQIKDYVSSAPNPTAIIKFIGTVISTSPSSPRVAAFSSRGPNHLTPEILKPDVIAPGVNILAGWTGASSPTDQEVDPRRVQFNIISGTSMACPHVSGLAALLKNAYPSWTPSAIKSALMTTTYYLDNSGKNFTDLATGKESSPFVIGSGHVDPNKALDPGLVYDVGTEDYIAFLCSIGYDPKKIAIFLKKPATIDCAVNNLSSPGNLNYPSFSVVFESGKEVVKYTRLVKNVGSSVDAVYEVSVNAPVNVDISVSPRKLVFSAEHQTLSYEITFTSITNAFQSILGSSSFGSIEWNDGSHRVRSPIAVRWVQGTQRHFVSSI
ncbi:subtilisin-like protease SBT1.4 [Silene latifolia]|uniref:subtilisin-like protease SBT1.4 n=1 Tax=Silene latifolia TaxID=37657 RepID=UPI003D77BF4F